MGGIGLDRTSRVWVMSRWWTITASASEFYRREDEMVPAIENASGKDSLGRRILR